MEVPDTWHLYVYCANDPMNYVDPSGHTSLPSYITPGLLGNTLSIVMKTAIRTDISAAASVYLTKKKYKLSRKMFNHALWGFGKKPGKAIKKLLRKKLRKSDKLRRAVGKTLLKGKKKGSVNFKKGDLHYSVGICSYKILKKYPKRKVKIRVKDRYDFTEFQTPLNTISRVSNDLGFLLEKAKVTYPYKWSVKISVKVKH